MTNIELVNKVVDIATNYKTCYMLGCWGFFANSANINEATNRTDVNNKKYYNSAVSIKDNGWIFDCVNLIKAVIWGWNGDTSKPRGGGAKYASNGLSDMNADTMIKTCKSVSTDFKNIEIGEAVWVPGHIGVYIGDSKVVECTPAWNIAPNGVKITNLGNHGVKTGWSRTWQKHGKIPCIEYISEDELNMTKQEFINSLTNDEALEIVTKARVALQNKPLAENDYSKEALEWAETSGLMVGNKGNLMPEDFMTRKQFVTVLKRYDDAK